MENSSEQNVSKKGFFEKYQTFIAIVICGVLVAGGLIGSKLIPAKGAAVAQNEPQSEKDARKEMAEAAKEIGLDKKAFAACVENGDKVDVVNDAIALAEKSGVSGTPSFFVIKRTLNPDKSVRSERQIMVLGARDKATFEEVIATGKTPAEQPEQPKGDTIILTDADHYMGPKDAEIIIVEYSDIDCPFCKRAKPIIDELLKEHPEYGFVYRHSPIMSLHPRAGLKAAASECAAEIGGEDAFWKFIDIVAK